MTYETIQELEVLEELPTAKHLCGILGLSIALIS
jgi:hypothetical protein